MPPRSARRSAGRKRSTVNNASSRAFLRSRRGFEVSAKDVLHRYLDECPLIAIVRGVIPDEAEATAQAVYDGGIRIIEVPLNSPDPLESIRRIASKFGDRMLVGAGTVVEPKQVQQVRGAGGRLIVAPNTDMRVITATVAADMVSCPGYFSASEAFAACAAGAT